MSLLRHFLVIVVVVVVIIVVVVVIITIIVITMVIAKNLQIGPSQVRSGQVQVRAGQVSSGQLRSGLHASGKPVLGRRRKKYKMYRTATYMRQKFTNEAKCEFHTTSSTSLPVPAIRMKCGFPSMSWTAVCEAKARTRSC